VNNRDRKEAAFIQTRKDPDVMWIAYGYGVRMLLHSKNGVIHP